MDDLWQDDDRRGYKGMAYIVFIIRKQINKIWGRNKNVYVKEGGPKMNRKFMNSKKC